MMQEIEATMTVEQAIGHVPHAGWPKGQGGGPCQCAKCEAARRIRGAAALEARREAMRRGYSQSVADRAASYRLCLGATLDSAIERAVLAEGMSKEDARAAIEGM